MDVVNKGTYVCIGSGIYYISYKREKKREATLQWLRKQRRRKNNQVYIPTSKIVDQPATLKIYNMSMKHDREEEQINNIVV